MDQVHGVDLYNFCRYNKLILILILTLASVRDTEIHVLSFINKDLNLKTENLVDRFDALFSAVRNNISITHFVSRNYAFFLKIVLYFLH